MIKDFTERELEAIRSDFPHTKKHLYLNHAAISPLSLRVKQALDSYIQQRHDSPIENFEQSIALSDEARTVLADYIHAPTPGTITYFTNTSEAISAVAEGLEWHPGDEILLNTAEFPANVQPFRALERKGVVIKYAEANNGVIGKDLIKKMITPKTKLLSISAVQYLSGFRADLPAIGALCRDRDIFFVVDGIQSLGAFPIDVQKAHIDALAAGGHKWLMGPMGLGFLYLSEKLSSRLTPAKTGWLSVEEPWELNRFNQNWKPVSQHLETGTPNMMGIIGLGASLKRFIDLGPERIAHRLKTLTAHLMDTLSENPDVKLFTVTDEKSRAGIVTFSIKGESDPDKVVQKLKKRNITISARKGYYRFSPHYYNTIHELDTAVDALLQESQ